MILLWTTNDKWGSRLIRWGLGEPSSHLAVLFFEGTTPIVFHSNYSYGIHTTSLDDFRRCNKIVHMLQCPTAPDEERELYKRLDEEVIGIGYDFYAIMYWCMAAFMRKFFGRQLPKENTMERTELVYCVEVLELIYEYLLEVGIELDVVDFSMMSPEQAYLVLSKCENLRDLPC